MVFNRRDAGADPRSAANIVCTQPFACLPNHVVGKGVIKELRRRYPTSNVVAIDFDPGASEVNQLNRIKLMLLLQIKICRQNWKRNSPHSQTCNLQGARLHRSIIYELRSFFCKGDEPKSGLAETLATAYDPGM